MTQYSIRPKRSVIRAQTVYFLHSTMPSVTCLRLSDVSFICRVIYIQFPVQSAFLQYIARQQAAPTLCVLLVLIRNIGRRTLPNIWACTFLVRNLAASPIDVVVFKCRKICPTRNRRKRALFTSQKVRLPL